MNVAIVGATGAVGEVLVALLEERRFPVERLYVLASSRSAGKRIEFSGKQLQVADVEGFDFANVGIAFFAAGGDIAAAHAPRAQAAGCIVIDKSSRFRMHAEVPLVVPEVNGQLLTAVRAGGFVASPNCSTAQLVMVLHPLRQAFGLRRVEVATYQAVSGAGRGGIRDLASETTSLLNVKPVTEPRTFAAQIAFNVVPQVERMTADGWTTEEDKLIAESRRILDAPTLAINPTCVRVPVFFGHGQALHLELERAVSVAEVIEVLAAMPGLAVHGDPNYLPTPVTDAVGKDEVSVGRVRLDRSRSADGGARSVGMNLWTVADNTRKGAALNSIQIAEQLLGVIG